MNLLEKLKAPTKEPKTLQDSLTEVQGQEALIIYRGESLYHGDFNHDEVSAWTTDEEVAHWYSSLNGSEVSRVFKAKIHTDNVTNYANEDGNHTILVNPDNLTEIELVFIY